MFLLFEKNWWTVHEQFVEKSFEKELREIAKTFYSEENKVNNQQVRQWHRTRIRRNIL